MRQLLAAGRGQTQDMLIELLYALSDGEPNVYRQHPPPRVSRWGCSPVFGRRGCVRRGSAEAGDAGWPGAKVRTA